MECINYQLRSGRVVRCNECIECHNYKRWVWTQRIKVECVNSKSWFLTLTYSGDEKEGYKDVQKMLKRLRKKHTFRFMCKSELQKRGVCHYHLAVHGDLTRRQVESEWKFGFTNAKLMKSENQLARYIAKYIAKDERKGKNYRASIRYGGLDESITNNKMVKEAMVHFPNSRIVKVYDPQVGDISLPWKYQYKNSPAEIKKFSKLGPKIRNHASLGGTGAANAKTTTHDEKKCPVRDSIFVDIMGGIYSLDAHAVQENKGGPMPYYNPEPRFRKTPARKSLSRPETNVRRVYSDRHEGWKSHPKPASSMSSSNIPKVETRNPRDIAPKIPFTKILGNPLLNALLSPSPTASPEETFYDWSKHSENVAKQIAQDNFVGRDLAARPQPLKEYDVDLPYLPAVDPNFIKPEVPTLNWFDRPETGAYISRSPKINTIEYVVPDYDVPPPLPVELPETHTWFDPLPVQDIPELLRDFDIPKIPEIDIQPERLRQRKPDEIRDVGVSIEIQAVPEKLPIVKLRPVIVRGSTPRKNDTKAHSNWIKLAHKTISLTYGTYTEVMDFVEILVWDAYYIDPRTGRLQYAMFREDYKMVNVLNGIAEGKYNVDIAATMVDYGVSQAQDILIGKTSQAVTRQVVDTGNWRSPQGPQGFINKMQKDYRNVLSQYETKSSNEQRLLSLQPLSESPRRLWNAKSGLSASVRG